MISDDKSTIHYDERPCISNTPGKNLTPDIYSVASSSTSPTLPSAWTLTKTKKSLLKSTLYITSSSSDNPCHAVSTHSTHPGATIHTTNDQASDALITARKHSNTFHVQMPSQDIDFKAGVHWRLTTHPRVEWNMPIPNGGVEHFEWTHSGGSWNLTRQSSAGQEDVVARWHFSYCSSRLSGEFEFVGSGASGELGDVFPYVAAVIALAIGKADRDTNMAVLAGTNS